MEKRTSDAIIIGGGIIGLSLALELRRRGFSTRVLERGEPGREASWAGAGMLAFRDPETPECLRELMRVSAKMYPEWVARIENESEQNAGLRQEGTLYLLSQAAEDLGREIPPRRLKEMEPYVSPAEHCYFTDEGSVDPRALLNGLVKAAKKNGVRISHEHAVASVNIVDGVARGVFTRNESFAADAIVNCAGAWAGNVAGVPIPTLPVKGQMLSVVKPHGGTILKHVVRGKQIYLVPRSDGRILIGATVEDAGFDKTVASQTILEMRDLAAELVPQISEMMIHESWAGLRPGSPDDLPILGDTEIRNYFVATGHHRNGILLAPVTAQVMAGVINGDEAPLDISAFKVNRFT